MKVLSVLYAKELKSFFISPVAYIVLFGCSLLIGLDVAFMLDMLISHNYKDITLLQACFQSFFFWIPLFVQIPFITMRAFSEEYKMGTIEMLLSAPVSEWEVVLAKYAAVFTFFLMLWSPIPINLSFLYLFSNQHFDYNWGMLLLPLLMIALIGSFYVAVGIFASALTKNQIVAAILCFVGIFGMLIASFLSELKSGFISKDFGSYLRVVEHMDLFARGTFDTRPVVLYLSGTAFFLFLTQRILEGRRLKG